MSEKRVYTRRRRRFALRFGIDDANRLAFTEDISILGMFIKTTNIPPPGSLININLILQNEQLVSVLGRVMWAKKVPPQMIHLVKKSGLGVKIEKFLAGEDAYQKLCKETLAAA